MQAEETEESCGREQDLVSEWRKWHTSVTGSDNVTFRSESEWASCYATHYKPMLEAALKEEKATPRRALKFTGRFFNQWLQQMSGGKGTRAKSAFEGIVSSLRKELFKGQASDGPAWELMERVLAGKISRGHLKLLEENVKHGADPLFVDLLKGEGVWNDNPPLDEKVVLKVLQDHLTEAAHMRGLIFDLEEPGVKELVMKAGVRVSPIVTAPKTTAHGTPQLDDDGEEKLRMCVHCSYGELEEAPNKGMRSGAHTRQKTTSPRHLVQRILQEEASHPNVPLRASKADLEAAFRRVGVVLKRVGLFATSVENLLLVNLTMIFGSGASPGDFEPLGDGVLKTVQGSLRENVAETGETHPAMVRFVDDYLSVVAMYGTRFEDHVDRLRSVIVALLGPAGINIEKGAAEGKPSCFKHAFGVVIDTVDRQLLAPWSKVVKLCNLTRAFVNGEQKYLTMNEIEKIRGVAQHVLFNGPGLGRMLLPRLDAAIADGARKHGGGKVPADFIPEPRLGHEDGEQAHELLRRALNIVLRLSTIEKGALLKQSYEASLPPEIRTTWPGKEGPESRVRYLMDASGQALFLIDLATGRFIQLEFTKEEQELFNNFGLGEGATTINHRELLSELFGGALFSPEHAGKMIELINDNAAAENWTDGSGHRHHKCEQVLSTLGLIELLLKVTFVGARVNTKDNFADTGTREDLAQEFREGLKELEEKHGWVAKRCQVDSWLREVGWNNLTSAGPQSDWFTQALAWLSWMVTEHPGLIEKHCGVDTQKIKEAFEAAQRGDPVPEAEVPGDDFQQEKISWQRREITRQVDATSNMLQKKLKRNVMKWGQEEGERRFCAGVGRAHVENPQQAICDELEASHNAMVRLLEEENKDFNPEYERAPSTAPRKLKLPEGCRQGPTVGITTGYSGTGAVEESFTCTGLAELLTAAEYHPTLRSNLQARNPDAEVLERVEELQDPRHRRRADGESYTPPCPAHSTANLYRQGNNDELGGQDFEKAGLLLEEHAPAWGHFECTLGVRQSKNGKLSPLDTLRRNLPSYHVMPYVVDAGRTISPLTDRQARCCHERMHVFVWRKSCFPSPPQFEPNMAEPIKEFESILDDPEEGRAYLVMPSVDHKAMNFHERTKAEPKNGRSIATIYKPEAGRGHHHFVNVMEDPKTSGHSVLTSGGWSKWVPRLLNGIVVPTKLRNIEGARGYCADGRQLPEEWLKDNVHMGAHAIGNMVPMNVADWIAVMILTEYMRVQADGKTAQEKWLEECKAEREGDTGEASGSLNSHSQHKDVSERERAGKAPTVQAQSETERELRQVIQELEGGEEGAGGKARPTSIKITPEEAGVIWAEVEIVKRAGKKVATFEAYDRHFNHWRAVAEAMGWSPSLDGLSPKEKCRRIIFWCAWERKKHKVKARTLKTKLAAVRWWHVSQWYANPLEDCPGIADWLANAMKMDGPAEPKLPVPVTLLQMIMALLPRRQASLEHASIAAALLTGFWFLLRSIEYLAEDDGIFDPDRSVTWGDVQFRGEGGQLLPWSDFERVTEVTLTLFSDKNSLGTCTRSVMAVPGSDVCVVEAMKELCRAWRREFRRDPMDQEPLFMKDTKTVYRRKDISKVLKDAAVAAGIPEGRISSHSLRRGGATAYVAAGAPEPAVQNFGRWTSDAYKGYVYAHSGSLTAALRTALHVIPQLRFERN